MDAKIVKLQAIENEYLDLGNELLKDEVVTNIKLFTKYSKKQAELKGAYDAYQKYKSLTRDIEDAKEMLKEDDAELKELAQSQFDEASSALEELDAHIYKLLLPRDPEDSCDCLVEIRGAVGGDEANIFAGDLLRMYTYYAESLGYKIDITQTSESEAGGYALVGFTIKGQDAYRHFKFESGGHRVQRVPKTETQGRVQTSIATVLVLPDVDDDEIEIPDSDLEIETHRSSGAGGQHINKTDSAVRIVHKPTGITVNCQDGRSQIANRETALKIIKARVFNYYKEQKEKEAGAVRKNLIGNGERSEKIRTYNYPQNRVTDHRIGLTINQLDRIVNGKLDDIVDALLENEEKEILLNENL